MVVTEYIFMDKNLTDIDVHKENEVEIIGCSQNINCIYHIKNFNDIDMNMFNCNDTNSKKDFLMVWTNHIKLEKINDNILEDNLIFIDSKMPEMLSWMVLYSYVTGKQKVVDLVDLLKKNNPLSYSNYCIYEYKCKKFLRDLVVGKLPNKYWFGDSGNNGCIVASIGEMILVCDGKNKEGLEKFLFNHTLICTDSTEQDNYVKVFKENGKYYINLNLQIRFVD